MSIGKEGIKTIVTAHGVTVMWNNVYNLKIELNSGLYFNDVVGLCETLTDERSDDFLMSENTVTQNVTAVGNSWKTNQKCADAPPPQNP